MAVVPLEPVRGRGVAMRGVYIVHIAPRFALNAATLLLFLRDVDTGDAMGYLRAGTQPVSLSGMPLERRTYALTYDVLEALRRLQEGSPAPGSEVCAWFYWR